MTTCLCRAVSGGSSGASIDHILLQLSGEAKGRKAGRASINACQPRRPDLSLRRVPATSAFPVERRDKPACCKE